MTPHAQILVSISGVLVMVLIALYQRKNGLSDRVWNEIGKKMDKESCRSFRTRIGLESDRHTQNIQQIKEDLGEIKSGVAFLKGKMNGE